MATIYLNADTGNDSTGSGTSGSPWKTISKAHTSGSSGDTVILQESTAAYTFSTQAFTKNLTIQGQYRPAVNTSTGAWGTINNLSKSCTLDGSAAKVKWSGAVTLDLVDLVVTNAKDGVSSQQGIFYQITDMSFTRCVFHAITSTSTTGKRGSLIELNSTTPCSITACIFYDFTFSGSTYSPIVAGNTQNAELEMYHSIVYGCPSVFNFEDTSSHYLDVRNNIFEGDGTRTAGRIHSGGTNNGVTFSYNNYYNFTGLGTGSTGVADGGNNWTTDPLFQSPANADFRLQSSSPVRTTDVLAI